MKNRELISKLRKTAAAVCVCAMMTVSLAACGSQENADNQETKTEQANAAESSTENNTEENTELTGSILMVGSTSMEKVANALCEAFMEKYTGVTATAEFSGSSAGVEAVLGGSADIGNCSRELKEAEVTSGAAANVIAIDGIAVCVDAANTVEGLTKQQLTDIYSGAVTNWSEVGGADAPVIVVGREAGSGTRGAFEELLDLTDACAYANELDSTGAVMAKVASTPGAIGYVSLDVLDDSVKALALEGVEPTVENIKAGEYFLSRPFIMTTNGAIEEQNELVQTWFDYVYSEEGQNVIAEVGLITVD